MLDILGFDTKTNHIEDEEINKLLEKRNKYRDEKNYQEADKIRDYLLEMDVEILDSREGSSYRKI